MPEFFDYPERLELDGTEVLVLLHGGQTKRVTTQEFIDASVIVGPAGPVGAPGGGWFGRYTYKSTTADADPGLGNLRLNVGTQNLATIIRLDLFGSDGVDNTLLLDLLDDSTSATKGFLRLFKDDDASKYIVFAVTGMTSPAGYRNVAVTPVAWSSANPFVADDLLLATFTATGNTGSQGIQGLQGLQGIQGVQGLQGGALPYLFDASTGLGDPGAGELRLNHATMASATAIYVDDVTSTGVSVAGLLAEMASSNAPIKGYVEIANADKTKSRFYALTAFGAASGYSQMTVTYISGTGTFTAAEQLFLSLTRNGDQAERITKAAYDALPGGPDPDTWYVIIG